jgi:hypothetical protein
MRVIIETVDDNELFSQTQKYKFLESGADDTINNWLQVFREILFNQTFDMDLIEECIPFRKGEQ